LSHISSPFCSAYFGDRVSHLAQANLDCDPPILVFPPSLGWQVCTTALSSWLRWGRVNFLPQTMASQVARIIGMSHLLLAEYFHLNQTKSPVYECGMSLELLASFKFSFNNVFIVQILHFSC
jgi:hypothetical protein